MHSIPGQDQINQQHQNEAHEHANSSTVTVLEALDPSQQHIQSHSDSQAIRDNQQVSSLLNSTGNQQQASIVQHLVQQPQLHQLQPSHAPSAVAAVAAAHETDPGELAGTRVGASQPPAHLSVAGSTNLLRPRPQIEGIVADGGGPIVQWLLDNYEIAEGESLPRSTVYNHYLAHCRHLQMASVNAASFGKLIRSVFIGLKTRRLGTRGHSKYHYFGVRAKQHIQHELMQHHMSSIGEGCNSNQNGTDNGSESDSTGGRLSATSPGKRAKRAINSTSGVQVYGSHHEAHQQQQETSEPLASAFYGSSQLDRAEEYEQFQQHNSSLTNAGTLTEDSLPIEQQNNCELNDFRNHLGTNWSTLVDELWPQRELGALERHLVKNTGMSELGESLQIFEYRYKVAYKRMLELLSELKFFDIEHLWQEFWHPNKQDHHPQLASWQTNGTQLSSSQQINGRPNTNCHHHDLAAYHQTGPASSAELTFHQLYQMTCQPGMIEWITQIDYALYACIESFLLPDMLNPIPHLLAQKIRLFAKNFKTWIEIAVKDYDTNFVAEKMRSARAFGILLRHYTSLNHLSTASRAVWDKRASLAQMSKDLSRVDLRDIEHQVSLMSHSQAHSHLQPTNNMGAPGEQQRAISQADLLQPTETMQAISGLNHSLASRPEANASDSNMLLGSISNNDNNDKSDKSVMDRQESNNSNSHTGNAQHLHPHQHHHHHHHHHHLCATMQPGQLIQNFLHLLEDPYPANSWPDWCRNLVESRVCGLSIEEARNFYLKWNFYITLIMKELTLRSATSFGSFYLIRLLFDEYIFYLVVNRLAQAQQKTPAQLLSLWLKL